MNRDRVTTIVSGLESLTRVYLFMREDRERETVRLCYDVLLDRLKESRTSERVKTYYSGERTKLYQEMKP
jgi:hypothetical protein